MSATADYTSPTATPEENVMTTTEITNISDMLDLGDLFGEYAADFDVEAITDNLLKMMRIAAREFAPSVTIARNGLVFADVDDADAARAINWAELAETANAGSWVESFDGDATERTYAVVASCRYRDEIRRYDIDATSPTAATAAAADRYGHESTIGVDAADVTVVHGGIVR